MTPDKHTLLMVLDSLDRGAMDIEYIQTETQLTLRQVSVCISHLISGKQIERTIDNKYKLTAKGHCKILTKKDKQADDKRSLLILFHKTLIETT